MILRLSLLASVLLLSACTTPEGQARSSGEPRHGNVDPSAATPTPGTSGSEPTQRTPAAARVIDRAGDVELTATLRDTPAARALLEQLPLTIQMRDHGGVEKTGPLPQRLPLQDEPAGANPNPAELGYYAPTNDLVLYYGDQSYFEGIIILGHFEGEVDRLANTEGDLTVQVHRATP